MTIDNGDPPFGSIVWQDLTVPDASVLVDFYTQVVGWRAVAEADCDGDFNLYSAGSEEPAAGLCFARGPNAGLPPHWLVYVRVPDVAAAARRCLDLGGAVVDGPRSMGERGFCVIRDPGGAYLALIE